MSKPVVNIWGTPPGSERAAVQPAPWDTKWDLRTRTTTGTAWVFYRSPGEKVLKRPVILADGFAPEGTDVDNLYEGLENGEYPFVSTLRQAGFDVILLGFADRTASVLDNAEVAIQCILQTLAEREGNARLTVGGFSMGGLVTRYALAKMERQRMQHETADYLSYDTPHHGAWLPLGVQAFAHFVKAHWGGEGKLLYNLYSDLINSPAARQMLRWHLATGTNTTLDVAAGQDKARTDFLNELERVGDWPQIPRLLGVANGTGTGAGNNIPADSPAMDAPGSKVGAQLRTQGEGRKTVAEMQKPGQDKVSINTTGFPEIDGAPGGLFPGLLGGASNFGVAALLADVINNPDKAELAYNASCFVPTISAVASADIDNNDALYGKIDAERSDLHDFLCATSNEGHTVMTRELGEWIVTKLKDS
ncbi:esterase/lipase family protein [Streptomyces sp. NPDC060010]|uniref:esterase/lipase family protein n=1 Tax=Streptomyces sp. NPDC060010 TaxID=3347036 RepID=UPI0036B251BA